MQILQWLFKVGSEPSRKEEDGHDKGAKSEDIVLFEKSMAKKRAGEGKFSCKNLNPFAIFLHRRDVAKTCFYSTLNLKRLESFRGRNRKTYSRKKKKEDSIRGLGIGQKAYSGNKVQQLRNMATLKAVAGDDQFSNDSQNQLQLGCAKLLHHHFLYLLCNFRGFFYD
ncbi:uncharacterized protein LOC130761693 isoform X2 [Actinidia eriantha]|uniref:uncharacterized protein LOC130761693 isoform X2 n=1 Tax=Actinidia eriantha TaxID=165200 RepID=UPI002584D62C|nr:uncharacterized protein LOC130761693 isoform X2 [Actinidia eriantha]